MPDPLNAGKKASSPGKAAAVFIAFLLGTVAAFLAAWFLAGAVCVFADRMHMRLADFTCGHNIAYPFALFFLALWPTFSLGFPALLRRTPWIRS